MLTIMIIRKLEDGNLPDKWMVNVELNQPLVHLNIVQITRITMIWLVYKHPYFSEICHATYRKIDSDDTEENPYQRKRTK